jgi:hypothetical protein
VLRRRRLSFVGALVLTLALLPFERAFAFGGLASPPSAPVHQTSETVVFVENPDSTVSAIIEPGYAGAADAFGWIIPVPGTPVVGLSSSVALKRLDTATSPQFWLEVDAAQTCSPAEVTPPAADGGEGASDPGARVLVLDRGSVGPYEYVTLAADGGGAAQWLADNGFDAAGLGDDALRPYLDRGLNLLAFKLTGAADSGEIRPLLLTYAGDELSLPLQLTAAAARDDMRLQVFVVGPSQAVPDNYGSLVLDEALFDWLSARPFKLGTLPGGGVGPTYPLFNNASNYDAVVTAAANEAGGRAFVTELAQPASQYRERVWSPNDEQQFMTLTSGEDFSDGIDAVLAANALYAGWDGWSEALRAATTLPDGVSLSDFAADPEHYRGRARVDIDAFFRQLEAKVVRPLADTAALLYNAPYLTRLYTIISPDEMTTDPTFTFNPELAMVSNIHVAHQRIDCSVTSERDAAPWSIALPHGGVVKGEGGEWPVALDALPANLKVVALGSSGSGKVLADHSAAIADALLDDPAADGGEVFQLPEDGLAIGGSQTVHRPVAARADAAQHGDGCSVANLGGERRAAWLPLMAAGLALQLLRRRRQLAALAVALLRRRRQLAALAVALLCACSDDAASTARDAGKPTPQLDAAAPAPTDGALTAAQLRDPESCKGCHPIHYRQWSSSIHAYAARDPVFIAMNKRGQRETGGKLGDFCITCHAPVAALEKRSTDGLNLDQLPDKDRGVSCFFCHNVQSIGGDHNALLNLANDDIMRGPLHDPLPTDAHRADYSELFEDVKPESSAMCGGCHDIVMPNGVHLERTFEEYRGGIFSKSATGEPPAFDSCVGCHMPGQQGLAAVFPEGAQQRTVHEHLWPGVDVPLIDAPFSDALRSAVEDCQLGLASVSYFTLEVTPPNLFTFEIETKAGHNQPSGSAQDRRLWLEFKAYDDDGSLIPAATSGDIADGMLEESADSDPHLWMFRDRIFDGAGKPVHMFWQAAPSPDHPKGYESQTLPVATTTYVDGTRAVSRQYRASGSSGLPARVTARLRMRPIGQDVLQDLVASGDLDPAVAARMPTFTFGTQIEWTRDDGVMKPLPATPKAECNKYRCMLDPDAPACR